MYTIEDILKGLVLTEFSDTNTWLLNYNKFNDEGDIVITPELAGQLIKLRQSLTKARNSITSI